MNEKLKKRNPYPLKIEGRGVEVSKTLFYVIYRQIAEDTNKNITKCYRILKFISI